MAKDNKPSGLVKVIANYGLREDSITLWGVGFTAVNGVYVAELPTELAQGLIEANRVQLA